MSLPLKSAQLLRVGTARRYLMCPPRYFTVSYVINPWMDPSRPVDTARAMAQWTALADTYRALGAYDMVMPRAVNEGAGDLIWTGRLLLAGTGFRTEPAAHLEAQEALG